MTQELANEWWNSATKSLKTEKPNSTDDFSVENMIYIFSDLSPVLHSHLSITYENFTFREELRNIMSKMTGIFPFPDPKFNFPLFLLYCYTFREILKPKTINDALYYATKMNDSSSFFLNKFIFSLSNPTLVITSFYRMNDLKYPQWMTFLSIRGNIEKIFDLFLPFIATPKTANRNSTLNKMTVLLSNFLVDLLITHNLNHIVLHTTLFRSLYHSIFKILVNCLGSTCYSYFRLLLLLNENAIQTNIDENRKIALEYFLKICSKNYTWKYEFINSMILKLGDNIFNTQLIAQSVAKSKNVVFEQIKCLTQLLFEKQKECGTIIIPFLSKILIQNVIFMQLVANILKKFFQENGNFQSCIEWFVIYIRYSFLTIRHYIECNKYKNRSIAFLSIIMADNFIEVKEIIKEIQFNAMLIRQNQLSKKYIDILYHSAGFDIRHDENKAIYIKEWEKDYDSLRVLALPMKFFPFQKHGNLLISIKNNQIIEPKGYVDPRINGININIDSNFLQFFVFMHQIDYVNQQIIIFQLEDLIDSENELLVECRKVCDTFINANISITKNRQYLQIMNVYRKLISSVEEKIFAFQKKQIDEYIKVIKYFIEVIRNHKELSVDIKKMQSYFEKERMSSGQYILLRNKRLTLWHLSNKQSMNMLNKINSYFDIRLFDRNNPEPSFDRYFLHFQNLDKIEVLADLLSNNDRNNDSLDLFLDIFYQTVKSIADEASASQIFINHIQKSLLRAVFNSLYTFGSYLNSYNNESLNFCKSSSIIAQNEVIGNIGIPNLNDEFQNIIIADYFSPNENLNLFNLVFYSSPLDIITLINDNLNNAYESLHLTKKNTHLYEEKVLYAMLIAKTPSNIMGINNFLEQWKFMLLSKEQIEIEELFIKVVNSTFNILELKYKT
ncbi:hypothetical protein TRFO_22008 [Tritrichomonas foetus]|uniref:Uncharacterized protein n=1 Tax=Tritrichomonas foetus TaxID=1144522 RepID=A0A1J4KDB2_9EUKA|nr:hypothetical protein TRFO_22008 [Tritrichomonas foetus]|eukprot:OHT09187.1 hypothetical protein TRFO_22008 [Tritrichomonas foetus]